MPHKYGVLLVAGGFTHQENYALGFQADPRASIVAVADERDVPARRAELNRRLAGELRVPYLPDLDVALSRFDVQVASVCVEPERMGRVAARCATAGKQLYLDKPLAGSVEEARLLEEAVRRAGVRSQMFTHINLPFVQRGRRALQSGRLGELRAIHCDLMFAKGHPGSAPLGRPRQETYAPRQFNFPDAKREMFNIAVYPLAMMRWLVGRRSFRSVRAVTANYFFEEHYRRGAEDFALLALTIEGGITATITCGRTGWMSHFGAGHNLTRLYGTRDSVLIDASAPRAEIASDLLKWSPPPRDPEDPMGFWRSTQVKAGARPRPEWFVPDPFPVRSDQSLFLDCLDENREPEVTAADGARVVEALLAAYRSAATGDLVRL